jgi:alpha-D-ribose 1-methylphosphonate 5-triphosphate synthase subunit PhnH
MIQPQLPGFKNPVHDAQTTFRAMLEALANPGSQRQITSLVEAPAGLSLACAAACLTLLDLETQVWLQPTVEEEVKTWLRFHTGCRFTELAQTANFAIIISIPNRDSYTTASSTLDVIPHSHTGDILDSNENRDNNCLSIPSLSVFNQGTDEEPEVSTTLLVQVENFEAGASVKLTGPGINGTRSLTVKGLSSAFWEDVTNNVHNYPLGVDIFLFTGDTVVGLPRTTKVSNQ